MMMCISLISDLFQAGISADPFTKNPEAGNLGKPVFDVDGERSAILLDGDAEDVGDAGGPPGDYPVFPLVAQKLEIGAATLKRHHPDMEVS